MVQLLYKFWIVKFETFTLIIAIKIQNTKNNIILNNFRNYNRVE